MRLHHVAPILLALATFGCSGNDLHGTGSGGVGGSGGGVVGGSGGSSEGGTAGAIGGAGGGQEWLEDEATWRDLPGVSSEDANVRVREAVPGALRFPGIEWNGCGTGCEIATVDQGFGEIWYGAMDTVPTPDGPRVWLAFLLPRDGYFLRRFVDLRSGETVTALRIETVPRDPKQVSIFLQETRSPLAVLLSSDATRPQGVMLRMLYDTDEQRWDPKLPWRDNVPGGPCDRFALDSSPPAFLIGCGGVSVISSAGSDVRTPIDGSDDFGSGAGNARLAAWTETPPGEPRFSRVRTWSPERGGQLLVESMPGVACGIGVSDKSVVGLRSGDPQQQTVCPGLLVDAEIWSASRGDGTVASWPVPGAPPIFASESATWGDYAAVRALTVDTGHGQAARSRIWLIRMSDGKMREITPSAGHEWRSSLFAFDDGYFYLGENAEGAEDGIAHVLRYKLDQFSEIGRPLE